MLCLFSIAKTRVCCCGPFEDDWQLVSLQKQGLIDHILTIDGDLFILGGDRVISELNYSSGACCIYHTEAIMNRSSMGGGKFIKEHLPLLSCFSGNNYIPRLYGKRAKDSNEFDGVIYLL